jgi:hypothetical protein
VDRFWSKVEKSDGCWNWTAGTYVNGYGIFKLDRRNWRAHRLSYKLKCGPIPDGMQVLHKCDNRLCVNPDHLFLGTNADNMADKVAKGREAHYGHPGERQGQSKLTNDQVLAIRASSGPHRDVAAEFGMSRSQVRDIRTRRAWKHI